MARVALFFAAVLSACAGPTAPDLLRNIDLVESAIVDVDATMHSHGRALLIDARLASGALERYQRVSVTIRTNRGDVEDALLGPTFCDGLSCADVAIQAESAEALAALIPSVEALPAAFFYPMVCGGGTCEAVNLTRATAVLFGPDPRDAARVVEGWPGVVFAIGGSPIGFTALGAPPTLDLGKVRGGILAAPSIASHVRGNGVLEIEEGATVFFEYVSPEGDLVALAVAP